MDFLAPDLLQALVAVAETGSFTAAARRLGLRQSTVSQRVRRLEAETGRRLFDRDTHRVALTPAGEAVLDHARRILALNERLQLHLAGVSLRGRLRFGASEDFVLSALPDVLAAFIRRHPEVDLELTAGLSETLRQSFDAGALDVILVKRGARDRGGRLAWQEPAAWVGRPDLDPDPGEPLPLLLYPPPSITRAMALDALDRAGRSWRVAFTSGSLSALSAAARAGIGVMPHSARLIPPGLGILPDKGGLPKLADLDFVVLGPGGRQPVAEALIAAILQWSASGRGRPALDAGPR
ncbi:LysR family transcriptional regulator [Aureimonas endophytica]|uniref:LysR family transcriptional regulator n=1 Tax=Aureimonas endophytica TaxID=2027858 RepID=A0A917E9Y4_9HYPH|nr:LysR family transcriptional regulator [Aureimonas endophytica]GGE15192.1 LysR family transcriptional regulator [Aureimonas endophytica]